ncbi:MAG: hypothetical protein ACYSSO_02065 [Planctomycetota bacterium]
MKKKAWIISIVCVILVISLPIPVLRLAYYCKFMARSRITQIDDISQKTTILLSKNNGQGNIDAITILITGHIDGSATIHPHDGGEKYPTYHIKSGKINLKICGDWYTDECLLEYEPIDVNSGTLKIRYQFHEF